MLSPQTPVISWYFHIFHFVAKNRLKRNDIHPREIHTQLVVVLTTGLLMWGYAFLAWFTINSPVPGLVGFAASAIHLASPLLFRFTRNSYIPLNVLLAAGALHQGTFAFYTGGFNSNILIWYGILPMLGGVCAGRKGAITWTLITVMVATVFFLLFLNGYEFPHLISTKGFVWAQSFLVFGWIFLSSSIVIVYAGLREHSEKLLQEQGQKIDDLFRVLFHDLANPLGRITIGLSIAKRQLEKGESNRGLEIASSAADSMMDITQNIRKMYAVRKGKANVDLSLTSLNSAVEYVQKIFTNELERKKLVLFYEYEKLAEVKVLVEPVSFKNQVLGNLVSNAIKFSPAGSTISISAQKGSNGTVIVTVKDQGIGIPETIKSQIFDINKKTSRPGTEGEQGSGFGMNIMKSFVDMYGGEIEIVSGEKPGTGTIIKLFLKGEFKS